MAMHLNVFYWGSLSFVLSFGLTDTQETDVLCVGVKCKTGFKNLPEQPTHISYPSVFLIVMLLFNFATYSSKSQWYRPLDTLKQHNPHFYFT